MRKVHTSRICMVPISPSASSNSTRSDNQNGVEPSLTWKAIFLPGYLHGVLHFTQDKIRLLEKIDV